FGAWSVAAAAASYAATRSWAFQRANECPLWVISGHCRRTSECPLYPQEQTSLSIFCMSALCQQRTSSSAERTFIPRAAASRSGAHFNPRLLILPEPRNHFFGEQGDVVDGLVVRKKTGMAHHQKVAHPAAMLAKIRDLIANLIRRAAEHNRRIYELLN